jgi:hypothetical protein
MAESEWTDELKQQVIERYEELEPTPDTTMEAVKTVANEFDKTPNGVRMVLSRAGVYVKKTTASAAKSGSSKSGTTRVNKAEAIAGLKKVIEDAGKEVDDDICDRLTGKAAVYITGLLS